MINYLLEGLSPAHLLILKPLQSEEYNENSQCTKNKVAFFFYNIKTEFDKEHLPRAFTKHSGRQMSCISLALEISSKMTENVVAMPFIREPTKGMLQK